MKAILFCEQECETCEGFGKIKLRPQPNPLAECLDCKNGVVEQTLDFEWAPEGIWCEFEREIYLMLTNLGLIIESGTGKNITDSLNPKRIEFYSVEDCPKCKGTHLIKLADLDGEGGEFDLCECVYTGEVDIFDSVEYPIEKPVEQWGKIERFTGFYSFKQSVEDIKKEVIEDSVKKILKFREHYSEDIFPKDGKTVDARSADMARITCDNIVKELTEPPTDGV